MILLPGISSFLGIVWSLMEAHEPLGRRRIASLLVRMKLRLARMVAALNELEQQQATLDALG